MSDTLLQTREPLLVFADDWARHPSSCQHLIRRMQSTHRILWVNSIGTRRIQASAFTVRRVIEKLRNWGSGLKQVAEQMWVVDLPMLPSLGWNVIKDINRSLVVSRLRRILSRLQIHEPAVLTTLPYMAGLIEGLPKRSLIYYCTDDYSHWPAADRDAMMRADRELSTQADLILAASRALVDQHSYTNKCAYFPHGVDIEHFGTVQSGRDVAAEIARIPSPRIGFFGLVYEKLDFTLLSAVAKRHPQASLVMIGPVVYCPPEFRDLPNVHLVGPKPYEQLPTAIAGLDVLLLPYLDDPMIRQSGPLKLRECLASGKPTVSVDVPDVRPYEGLVRIGASHEAFVNEVSQALGEAPSWHNIRRRQEAVAQDGWDRRVRDLQAHLATVAASEARGKPCDVSATHRPTRKRVLHLRTVSGRGGGPEKTLLNSPRFLRDAYEVRLLYLRPQNDPSYDMPERAAEFGVDLIDVPERGPVDARAVRRLLSEIKRFRPHLLHAHDYKTNVLGVMLGKLLGIPVITTMHGYVERSGKLDCYYRADRWALPRMDHVVAVSPDLYETALEMGVARKACSVIDNAIDCRQFQRRRSLALAKAELGIDSSVTVIGAVGRLSPEKGFDLLIRAVGRLQRPGIKLLIIGEGEQHADLAGLIGQLGAHERVTLLGHRTDVKDLYEAMDVFVLSSRREGLPNVVLEAMALETPVIATNIAGVPRVIEHGRTGMLVAPDDEDGLAAALESLVGDVTLRDRLRRAARAEVMKRFSFDARMDKIREIYDRLLRRTLTTDHTNQTDLMSSVRLSPSVLSV